MLKVAAPIWQDLGWQQNIVSTAQTVGSFADELSSAGFWVEHCPEQKKPSWPLKYGKALARIKPDVVHVHSERLSLVKSCTAAVLGASVFRTIHNVYNFEGCLRIRKLIERSISRHFGVQTVAISKSVFDNELMRLRNPSTLCWNWFNDKAFRPPSHSERLQARRELGLDCQDVIVLTVGNGSDVKNYSALIYALSRVNLRLPNIKYLMVGHEHPHKCERQATVEAGMEDSVIFAGPQVDVCKFLWAADIFAMPSHFEGFGLAAVEALATGIRCIFSDCPGLRDFKLFPLDITWASPRVDSIEHALEAVLRQSNLATRDREGAAFVKQHFGVERRATAYSNLWAKYSVFYHGC
jgi:glycosyltransferase involved in cell wall biosynthesis